MYENGFITLAEYDAAMADQLVVLEESPLKDQNEMLAFVDTASMMSLLSSLSRNVRGYQQPTGAQWNPKYAPKGTTYIPP